MLNAILYQSPIALLNQTEDDEEDEDLLPYDDTADEFGDEDLEELGEEDESEVNSELSGEDISEDEEL